MLDTLTLNNQSNKEHFGLFSASVLAKIRAAGARAVAAKYGAKHPNMNLFPNGSQLRLKTWRNNYVMMVNNGIHVKQGGAGNWERFTVKRLPQFGANCVALYGWHKRYLRAHGNKKTIDQSAPRSNYNDFPNGWGWERFWLEDVGSGKIALRTYQNTYLRAHSNGWMDQSGIRPKGIAIPSGWVWEKFTPEFILPIAHFVADNYTNNKNWRNIRGGFPNATQWAGNAVVRNHSNNGRNFKAIQFNQHDGLRFHQTISTPSYTLIVVGRNRRNNGRVIDGTSNNVLHGWWGNRTGVYHQGGWITHTNRGSNSNWHIMAATNNGLAYMDGTRVGKNNHKGRTPAQWTINWGQSKGSEWTQSDVAEMIFFNRHLNDNEIVAESNKLKNKYGIGVVSKSTPANMNLFPNGKILRLKTWRNNYVMMVNNGTHVRQGGAGNWERFTVKRLPQFGANCVALYGWHKRYLRAHGNKKTIDQSAPRSNYNDFPSGWGWERFWLEDVGGGKIALRTYHGTYLRTNSNGWMDQSSTIAKGKPIPSNWVWEKFTPMFIGGAPKRPVNVYGAKPAPKKVGVYGTKPAPKPAVSKKATPKKPAPKKPAPKKPAHKSAVLKKITYKSKKDIPINTNNAIKGDIDISNVPDIVDTDIKLKFTYPDKSMGKTNNLKSPNMSMKVDMKDTTKFELFGSEKNTNNISNILAIFLLIIFLIILYFQKN